MKNILFVVLVLFAVSCGDPMLKKEKALVDDIHRLHDVETMPKMGQLVSLKEALGSKEGLDSIQVLELKKDLKDADDAMMGWMNQFNWPSDATPVEERVKYYEEEVKKLEEMKDIMYSAIDNAEKALK